MGSVILVCGLNGAGKSTLAKALAERLNLRFIDIEDIYFSRQDNPDYPYEKARPYEEVVSMLTNIANGENNIVLASVRGSFGEEFVSHFPLIAHSVLRAKREVSKIWSSKMKKEKRSASLFLL